MTPIFSAGAMNLKVLLDNGAVKEPSFPVLFNNDLPVNAQARYDAVTGQGGVIVNRRGPTNTCLEKAELFAKIQKHGVREFETFEAYEEDGIFNMSKFREEYSDESIVLYRGHEHSINSIANDSELLRVYDMDVRNRAKYGYGVIFVDEQFSTTKRHAITYAPSLAGNINIRLVSGLTVEKGYITTQCELNGAVMREARNTTKLVMRSLELDYGTMVFSVHEKTIIIEDVHTRLVLGTEDMLLHIAHAKKYNK